MESFGLYEDLSLFSGDLLVGINPLADELPTLEQDVCTQESSMFPVEVHPFTDEPIKSTQSEQIIVTDDWMEKKLELINLFASSNVQITIQNSSPDIVEPSLPPSVEVTSQSPIADSSSYTELAPVHQHNLKTPEELLQSVSEYLTSDLEDSSCSENTSVPFGDFSMDNFSTADGLASMFGDEDLIKTLSNPILSPVSPQDIESILSAGPSSPCSTASINDGVVPQVQPEGYVLSIEEPVASPCSSIDVISYSDEAESVGPMRPKRASRAKKYSPYESYDDDYEEKPKSHRSSTKIPDRKERKKQQNKDAALRYRMKKKQEQSGVFDECDELEKKNEDLKDKVDSMTREIQYLKDLLLEVYKAKGIQPKGLLVKKSK